MSTRVSGGICIVNHRQTGYAESHLGRRQNARAGAYDGYAREVVPLALYCFKVKFDLKSRLRHNYRERIEKTNSSSAGPS